MVGLGTIINTAAIVLGGVIGNFTGKLFREEQQTAVGSILIFCVGVNLVWGKTIKVANMLPGIIFAVAAAYLPWTL